MEEVLHLEPGRYRRVQALANKLVSYEWLIGSWFTGYERFQPWPSQPPVSAWCDFQFKALNQPPSPAPPVLVQVAGMPSTRLIPLATPPVGPQYPRLLCAYG
jgi:hypothetical protein